MTRDGIGCDADIGRALEMFQRSADAGFVPAMGAIVQLFADGNVTDPAVRDRAVSLMEARAEGGDREAMVRLANMCFEGAGVERDPAKALYWYSKAADCGDAWARLRVGEMTRDGIGCDADMSH